MDRIAVNRRIRKWLTEFIDRHLPEIFKGWPEGARLDALDAIGKRIEDFAYHSKTPDKINRPNAEYQALRQDQSKTDELASDIKEALKHSFAGIKATPITFRTDLKDLDKETRGYIEASISGGVDSLSVRHKDDGSMDLSRELKRQEFQKDRAKNSPEKVSPISVVITRDGYWVKEGRHRFLGAWKVARESGESSFSMQAYILDYRDLSDKISNIIEKLLPNKVIEMISKKSSISFELDRIASVLEEKGLPKYARTLDVIANTLDSSEPEYRIYVDMDGVLCDFVKKYKDITGEDLSANNNWNPDKSVLSDESFWSSMDWMEDGKVLWDFVKDFNPTILSSPGKGKETEFSIPGKQKWLKTHIGKVPKIFEVDKFKHAEPKSILIDDYTKNTDAWEAHGGIAILHTSARDTISKLKGIISGVD